MLLDCVNIALSPLIITWYYIKRKVFLTRKQFPCVLITGGSSGIGQSLAIEFSKCKYVKTLIIVGRNENRLKSTIELCQKNNPDKTEKKILYKCADVRNTADMKRYINEWNEQYHLDLVIANDETIDAGISVTTMDQHSTSYNITSKILFDVNVTGVTNTIAPAITMFQRRFEKDGASGHIAVVGSLSGYFATCDSCAYSGLYKTHFFRINTTKSMVRFLCEDLRPQLAKWNIDLTWIGPAFTGSNMCPTELNSHRLGFRTSEQAASIIRTSLEWNEECIDFPTHVFTLASLLGSMHPIFFSLFSDTNCSQEYADYNF
ncbi:short-chain dehydrogenase [Reticulomyxa filosa]|uniref:Short-chain dehydrogenase n=1 Tax=Reticulomyxa filosa TaxID=46433 RepID=X6NW68_RETFI|nr:short-chain dehydrogenase [Reticulomyxa filosa]|eukprot:ETO30128.1 short-chain dehydrogenase [Reticulomyxa filosa]